MKALCYFILMIAFFIYFQKNPVYTVIIIGIGVVLYIFFRSRKSGRGTFFSGKRDPRDERIDDLIMLMMLQQLFSQPQSEQPSKNKKRSKDQTEDNSPISPSEQEILDLLDGD